MTGMETFKDKVEKWIEDFDQELELGEHYLDDVKNYVESSLKDADSFTDSNPSEAYSRVVKLANVSAHMARKKPALVELLGHYVEKFVAIMEKVKKALGAVSFTITVSFPFDMSISLTF